MQDKKCCTCVLLNEEIKFIVMIKITFPDGTVREYEKGITALQIAEKISSRLAQEVMAATVNGQVCDLMLPIEQCFCQQV